MPDTSDAQLHVVFGTGSLGLAVMREVLRRGHRVRGVSRSGKAQLPAGAQSVRDDGLGRAWHLPCPPPLTQRELLDAIFRAAGHDKTKVQALPSFMTKALGWLIPIMRELAEMQYQWERDYVFDCSQFTAKFEAQHVRPHAQTVVDTLAWFRANPQP
jgi:nucleoside-diphosphate-sugar epimerase